MFTSSCAVDWICRRSPRHLNTADHDSLCANLEAALVCYNSLAADAIYAKRKLWKIVPKFHAATMYYDIPINPRRVQCYLDEDMVGRCKRIYIKCHGLSAPQRSIERYIIMICMRWLEALRCLRNIPFVSVMIPRFGN